MSISKSKNLERKLNNIAQEATNELNNVCGSSLWESLGFGASSKNYFSNVYYLLRTREAKSLDLYYLHL
jgi:hypothetical protein